MKKVWMILILLTLSFAFIPVTYSVFTPEENIAYKVDDWSIKYDLGSYYIESEFFLVEHDYLYLTLGVTETETIDQEFIEPGQYSYVDFFVEPDPYDTPIDTKYFSYEEEPWSSFMILSDWDFSLPVVTDPYNMGTYKGSYAKIKLQLKRDLSAYDRGQLIYILNSDDAAYLLDWNFNAYNDITNPMTLLDLPETLGNPFESDDLYYPDTNYYGTVDFSYINGDVTLFITYQGYYVYSIPDVVFTDDSFLENVYEVYYYTVDTERYLYFAYEEDDNFLLTDGDIEAKTWTGFTIWNLTTNEVVTTQRVWALTYIEIVDLNAYAYFHLPTVPEDDLLSVSVTFTYRLGKKGPTTLWQQRYLDWETKALFLQKDAESVEEGFPKWVYDTWTYSTVAMVGGALLTAVGGGIVGLPIVIAGGVAMNVANVGALHDLVTQNIDQLQKVAYPSSTLVNTLNEHYTMLTGVTVDVTDEPVYKLALGEFTGVDVNAVEFDTSNYKYTEIVFTSNGTVYSVTEDYIDNQVIVDVDYTASLPEASPKVDVMGFIMLPMVTVLFIGIAFKTKSFNKPSHLILIVGLYILVLFLTGGL